MNVLQRFLIFNSRGAVESIRLAWFLQRLIKQKDGTAVI